MRYQEAQKYIADNQELIGTTNPKGFVVSELIAVPSNENGQKEFIERLISGKNNEKLVDQPDVDFQVWALDTAHLQKARILFYDIIAR